MGESKKKKIPHFRYFKLRLPFCSFNYNACLAQKMKTFLDQSHGGNQHNILLRNVFL